MRVDAHHHMWHYTAAEYGWIDDAMRVLRRNFLLEDLRRELEAAKVDAAVAVQARQTEVETDWLLQLASDDGPVRGVVGWLPIASPDFAAKLDRYRGDRALRGLRHVVQGEAEGFLDGSAFNRGMARLKDAGLVYDILIYAPQLAEATRFVDRHAEQPFVVDHLAKPSIRRGEIESWARDLRDLARRPHVACKVSGMVTEADPLQWTGEQLRPYFEIALECFGAERLMIGSDWPVLTVGCTYVQWWQLVEQWLAPLSMQERQNILGDNANRVYGLKLDSASRTKEHAA